MSYRRNYEMLQTCFDLACDQVDIPGGSLVIQSAWFNSSAWTILPGASSYDCALHGLQFPNEHCLEETLHDSSWIDVPDTQVLENRRFRYATVVDRRDKLSNGAILLLHGLNERTWNKYLPWAQRLVQATGKAVILFPIAFHMNRAPSSWGDARLMRRVSEQRQSASQTLGNSTFANAAISTRLQQNPQRFCWSGLQTLRDVEKLLGTIRAGLHRSIAIDSRIDIFAYSIGAFLSQVLLMANPGDYFTNSRLFLFCGGATIDRMYPNSRYILDSDSMIALYSLLLARLPNELRHSTRLDHYIAGAHREGEVFRWLLSYHEHKVDRELGMRRLAHRVAALTLCKDTIVPPSEVMNTLQGERHDIPIAVRTVDFPYDYSHMVPFPVAGSETEVTRAFDGVFAAAAEHLTA
jgi:hypothetical protein